MGASDLHLWLSSQPHPVAGALRPCVLGSHISLYIHRHPKPYTLHAPAFQFEPGSLSGYRLEDVLAAIRLRTGSLDIFPEARGRETCLTPNLLILQLSILYPLLGCC